MKKTIAIMLMFATGCMSLAGCAETEVIETAEGTELFETEAVVAEASSTNEAEVTVGETDVTVVTESSAAEETPDGGYIRYTYRADETTGERTLYKVEEYDADGHLISDMNYGSVGQYGVTFVYVDGRLTEEWYTNTDGETYMSSSIEYAVFGDNECKSFSYHYDHDELIGYTEYEYDEQGELCVRTNEYDADGNLTSYKEYVYEADGSCTITEYNADGTTTGTITIRNADGDMVTKISGYGSDEHVYRTEYIRNDNGDVIRIELYEDDVLLEYKEYEYYSAGRRSSITSYQADGTVVYTNVCEYEYLDG